MKFFNKISDGIYLGNLQSIEDKTIIKTDKISHILYLGIFAKSFEANYKIIEINEIPDINLFQYFDECNEYINIVLKNQGKIFICCDSGSLLSPAIVIAYIMKRKGCSYIQALEFVKKKHPETNPSQGISSQLRSYQSVVSKKIKYEGFPEISCGCQCFWETRS